MQTRTGWRCGLPAALVAVLLLLSCVAPAAAQGYQASRVTAVNGRQVLEVRMGIVPGNQTLRTLVVTAGPVAGSTSLLASATPAGDVMNPALPMLFSVVVNSGSLFSLGGGCPRAGELNFPYIDGLQFRIVRYTGTTQTIVTPPAVAGQFEGVNCTTAPNGQFVFYTLANRTTGRIEVWREGAGNAFVRVHSGTAAIRLPFNGGIRPQISRMFRRPPSASGAAAPRETSGDPLVAYEPAMVLILYQLAAGGSRVEVIDTDQGSVRGTCPLATRTAGPPPFEAGLAPDYVVGDFDGNGVAEALSLGPSVDGLCEVGSRTVNLGSAAGGNGFTWTGFALAGDTLSKEYRVLNGQSFVFLQPASVTPSPSPFAGRGGPFDAVHLGAGEFAPGILAVGSAASNQSLEFFAFAPAFTGGVFVASFEDPVTGNIITIGTAPSPP
jgi:hypothetical protein